MKITEIREQTASLRSWIRNAVIDFSRMTTSVVALVTDVIRDGRPIVGYGFNSNGRYAVGELLRARFIPRILEARPSQLLNDAGDNFDPSRVWDVMMTGEKPGGHGERSVAVGAIDMALWDAVAKIHGVPLYRLLSDRYRHGEADATVFVYAAGGYYHDGKDTRELQDEVRRYLDLGFTTVKMKIGGASLGDDMRRIETVIAVVGDPGRLAVDANGRFDLATALEYAREMEPLGLRWYEEAGDPLDYELQAQVCRAYSPPVATGENLFSVQDVRNLLRYAGMRPDRDIVQLDPALSYGLVEYLRVLDAMREHGWSPRRCIPHGGHLFAVHVAAGLGTGGNESYPGVFLPFGRFTDDMSVSDGRVRPPEEPGIGYEANRELYAILQTV